MATIHVKGAISFEVQYLEEIAERLTKFYGREVLVSDYERYLDPEGCEFTIFGDVYTSYQTKNS